MPYDTPYNRMISRNQQRTDEEYADYQAYSNQNFLSDGSMGDARGNIRLFPKAVQRDIDMPLDYSGGITARNMEGGYGPLRHQLNDVALGEDTRRFRNKSAYTPSTYPFAREGSCYQDRNIYSSESEDDCLDDMYGGGVPEHEELLKHLLKLKLPKDVHSEIVEWLEEMDEQGRGMEGRGAIWDFVKEKAGMLGNFIKDNIKPIAKFAMPFLKKIPRIGPAIEAVTGVIKKVPGAAGVLSQYGLGRHGRGVVVVESPESGDELSDVRTVGRAMPAAMMQVNENPLIGVPMRKPGFMKSTGLHFEGASLGAGRKRGRPRKVVGGSVIGGPSNDPVNKGKITGGRRKKGKGDSEEDAELSEIFDKKLKMIEPVHKLKQAVSRASVAVPKSPEDKRKREKSDSPKAPKAKKTGSALFKKKGAFPIETKAGEPLTQDQIVTSGKLGQGLEGSSEQWTDKLRNWARKQDDNRRKRALAKAGEPLTQDQIVTSGKLGQGRKRRGGAAKSALSAEELAKKLADLNTKESAFSMPVANTPPKRRASILKAPAVAAAPEPISPLVRKPAVKRKAPKVDTEGAYTGMYEDMSNAAEVPDQGKGKGRKKGGMLKSQLPGSSFSGMGDKKTSPWIAHVKAYAKAHSIKYKDALKAAAPSYKK